MIRAVFNGIQGGVVGASTGSSAAIGTQSTSMSAMSTSSAGETHIHADIRVSGDDPKSQRLLKALADLLGSGTGLDAVVANYS